MKFDHEQLRSAVKAKREREGLTLRDVEIETGVSRSTVCRYERGVGAVDADTAATLANFTGLSMSQLVGEAAVTTQAGNVLEDIEGLLRCDKNLRPSDAEGLMTIMRTAYRRAVEHAD